MAEIEVSSKDIELSEFGIMKSFESQTARIASYFADNSLPGLKAHLKMAPITRLTDIANSVGHSANGVEKGSVPRKSAVLVLLYPKNERIYLVMMVRAEDNTVHSGQVSFPGGKVERGDTDIQYTALRETHEEIGVHPDDVEIIGELTKLYIPPSNFDVYPIVGIAKSIPIFKTNCEVNKLLEIELSSLIDSEIVGYETIKHRSGNEFVVPCFNIQGEVIWGASAMILSEFLEFVKYEWPSEKYI